MPTKRGKRMPAQSNPKDRFEYEESVPSRLVRRLGRSVWTGIYDVRRLTGMNRAVRVRVYRIRGKLAKPIASDHGLASLGYTTAHGISIGVSPQFTRKPRFFQRVVGTSVHEYVHFLRFQLGLQQGASRTILGSAIEEGIAIFAETALSTPPIYLDLRTLNERMVAICWDKLSEVLPIPEGRFPKLLKAQVYREIYYRLGYGIVRRYLTDHPRLTLTSLIRMKRTTLQQFARKVYGRG